MSTTTNRLNAASRGAPGVKARGAPGVPTPHVVVAVEGPGRRVTVRIAKIEVSVMGGAVFDHAVIRCPEVERDAHTPVTGYGIVFDGVLSRKYGQRSIVDGDPIARSKITALVHRKGSTIVLGSVPQNYAVDIAPARDAITGAAVDDISGIRRCRE